MAVFGVPDASFKGLILLSHGIGGSELGHGRLAEGLARAGYLVAALRHPGDNWQERTADAVFDTASLAGITVPLAIYQAERDTGLAPRFHCGWVASIVPGARLQRVAQAGHFAFMDTPGMAIATEDGDIRTDPPGFDQAAFLAQLASAQRGGFRR